MAQPYCICKIVQYIMSRDMRFPTIWYVPPAKFLQSDQSLCKWLEYSMSVKLLSEHHLEVQSLKAGCTCSSKYTLVKMSHCSKSHAAARICKILQ